MRPARARRCIFTDRAYSFARIASVIRWIVHAPFSKALGPLVRPSALAERVPFPARGASV